MPVTRGAARKRPSMGAVKEAAAAQSADSQEQTLVNTKNTKGKKTQKTKEKEKEKEKEMDKENANTANLIPSSPAAAAAPVKANDNENANATASAIVPLATSTSSPLRVLSSVPRPSLSLSSDAVINYLPSPSLTYSSPSATHTNTLSVAAASPAPRMSLKRSLPSPISSPSAKLACLSPSVRGPLSVEFERLNSELASRLDALKHQCDADISNLRFFFNRQLTRLPPRVRSMPISQFCSQFGLDVASVNLESAVERQRELENFVAQTPSLRTSRKHRELMSLQAPIGVLMSAQRMTRASARKAMASEPVAPQPLQPLIPSALNPPNTVQRLTRATAQRGQPVFETPANANRRLRPRRGPGEAAESNLLLTVDQAVAVDMSADPKDVVKGLNTLGAEERGKIIGKLKGMNENLAKVVAEF